MKAATRAAEDAFKLLPISIHAAREGGDDVDYIDKLTHTLFQSTPPVKAATGYIEFIRRKGEISIHAAREGGDKSNRKEVLRGSISIHAAREGGDTTLAAWMMLTLRFQSTPPVKAATASPTAREAQ